MTTTALHRTPPAVAGPAPTFAGPDDVAAWLDEAAPVVHALPVRTASPSIGRERWVSEQLTLAVEALALLEGEAFEAEHRGTPCDDLLWLHTRVSALVQASHVPGRLPLAA